MIPCETNGKEQAPGSKVHAEDGLREVWAYKGPCGADEGGENM